MRLHLAMVLTDSLSTFILYLNLEPLTIWYFYRFISIHWLSNKQGGKHWQLFCSLDLKRLLDVECISTLRVLCKGKKSIIVELRSSVLNFESWNILEQVYFSLSLYPARQSFLLCKWETTGILDLPVTAWFSVNRVLLVEKNEKGTFVSQGNLLAKCN